MAIHSIHSIRSPNDASFIKDTKKTLGSSFLQRGKWLFTEVNVERVEKLAMQLFSSDNKIPVTRSTLLGKVVTIGIVASVVAGAYYLGMFSQLSNLALQTPIVSLEAAQQITSASKGGNTLRM